MIRILNGVSSIKSAISRPEAEYEAQLSAVRAILADVKARGDAALFEYTEKFDGVRLSSDSIKVSKAEIDAAACSVDGALLSALKNAKDNILEYAKRLVPSGGEIVNGTGYVVRPVSRAGIYVPGGTAAYPSSVLMCALAARAAGVEDIIMVSPPAKLSPVVLTAASLCGITDIYRVGGAQSIAALAYGTESVPRADVIAGPGNIYVALAKREVFGEVGIDMVAGPSEILIIADDSARADFVAADMLSQAEHDTLAASILITTSRRLADEVAVEIDRQLKSLSRRDIAAKAIEQNSVIVVVDSTMQALKLSNDYAPEHLELCVSNPEQALAGVVNAGAVFLGNYSPEPLGDYYAGTNHVLPTGGTARFFSALSPAAFLKKISVINYDFEMLCRAKGDIIELAESEGLTAHAEAVRIRSKV